MHKLKKPRAAGWWGYAAESAVLIASLIYILSGSLPALFAWEFLALAYLVAGGIIAWRMPARQSPSDLKTASENRRWAWVLPTVSSATGAYSAVFALLARDSSAYTPESAFFALAASVGVVLSWLLLHVGFANMYRYMAQEKGDQPIAFPGTKQPDLLDFLYFSFTIGTSFATSDVSLCSSKVRRVALLHGVISFFYNALVIAIAIQVLQFVLSQP